MAIVGLVANPGASRDVRRLTSLARTIDAVEQANTVARVLSGLAAGGATEVRYMPEPSRVIERALDLLRSIGAAGTGGAGGTAGGVGAVGAAPLPALVPVALAGAGDAKDAAGTTEAAAAIGAAGAACVITVGGDGTNRAVATGWPEAVFVPLPGGTNNAFALRLDPTAAGLAAALYARDPAASSGHVRRHATLSATLAGGRSTIALVDIALVRAGWVGAHAVWEPETLVEAIVARSDPSIPGLAGVGGCVAPLADGEDAAIHLVFGADGRTVLAPLGPGHVAAIGIRSWRTVGPGDAVVCPSAHASAHASGALTLAFDGEREIVLEPGERLTVRVVTPGVRVLDAASLLRSAARDGLLGPEATASP